MRHLEGEAIGAIPHLYRENTFTDQDSPAQITVPDWDVERCGM